MNALNELHEAGQCIWLDNITRELLTSGTLTRYISELSVTGLTSNPTIFERAISGSSDYDDSIKKRLGRGLSAEELFFEIAIEDLAIAADCLRPIYEASGGTNGFVSLEVSPMLANDTAGTINTVPEKTLLALSENGEVGELPGWDSSDSDRIIGRIEAAGVDLASVASRLQGDGREAFTADFEKLLRGMAAKASKLG